jgi:hypothetical protein
MSQVRLNLAADINRLHELANQRADEAIEHAKAAGLLLLEAKAAVPHGEWLGWLETNVFVTPRQVQRYMRVAQGKPLPIRAERPIAPPAKNDTVSHLEVDAPRLFPGDPDAADFVPEAGYCYSHVMPDTTIYVVEPSIKHPGYFFVSKMDAATDMVDYTRRPVAADWVEANLEYFGLSEPATAKWLMKPSAGVLEALETFPGCAA